jgi:hypothetical protein
MGHDQLSSECRVPCLCHWHFHGASMDAFIHSSFCASKNFLEQIFNCRNDRQVLTAICNNQVQKKGPRHGARMVLGHRYHHHNPSDCTPANGGSTLTSSDLFGTSSSTNCRFQKKAKKAKRNERVNGKRFYGIKTIKTIKMLLLG